MTETTHIDDAARERLTSVIAELEALAPREGAVVRLYADDDEQCSVDATQRGFVRLAAELLRAARLTEADRASPQHALEIVATWLLPAGSRGTLALEQQERIEVVQPGESTAAQKAAGVGCLLGTLLLIACMLVGMVTVAKWLVR